MGGAQSDPKTNSSLEQLYKIVKRSADGLSMLEERTTGKEYLLREITSNLQNDFERLKTAIEKRRGHSNQHLLAIRQTYTRTESNFCSNEFKLFLMVEYPFRNLYEEIEERKLTEDYFRENQLWSIIYSCCLGLKEIYGYQGRHEALSSDRIYIEKDGLVKIGDPFVLGHQTNCDTRVLYDTDQHIYLSPEQIEMLLQSKGGYRPDLSDVFTIGIIMMEAACLFPMADLYEEDHNYINSDKIKERLSIIEGRYSFKLRFLIEKMLRADPKQRISLVDIEHTIQSESFEEDESRSGGLPYSNAPTQPPQSIANNGKRLEEVKPKPAPNLANNGSKETVARYSTAETNPDRPGDRDTLDRLPLQQLYTPTNVQPTPSYDFGKGAGGSFSTVEPYSVKFNSYGTAGSYGGFDYQPSGLAGGGYYPSSGFGVATSTFPLSSGYSATSGYSSHTSSYTPSLGMGSLGLGISPYNNISSYKPTGYPLSSAGSYMPSIPLSSEPYMSTYKPYEPIPSSRYATTSTNEVVVHPQSPVDAFNQYQKNPESFMEKAARISPPIIDKQSLSPVKQLETPERKDKQNRNAIVPNQGSNSSEESGSSSAYHQVASLLPNSTIAQVTENEFSGSSENSLKYEVLEYEQGSRYEGYTLRGMRHGFGKFYYQDGGHYEGEWKDNKMNGFAKLYYQNNDLAYEGLWKDDQFHGKGKVFNDNPRKIEGCFDYTNLSALDECWIYYDGEFDEDSKHGHGTVKLSNGETFEGQFERDVINGEGIFHTLKNENVHGIWRENRLVKRMD